MRNVEKKYLAVAVLAGALTFTVPAYGQGLPQIELSSPTNSLLTSNKGQMTGAAAEVVTVGTPDATLSSNPMYAYKDTAEESNTQMPIIQYEINKQTGEIVNETTKYLNISKTTYANGAGTISYSYDPTESYYGPLIVETASEVEMSSASGNLSSIIDGIERIYSDSLNIEGWDNNFSEPEEINGYFIRNNGSYSGGAIDVVDGISSITGNFLANSASCFKGGAIANRGVWANESDISVINNITGDFISNSTGYGGAISNGFFEGYSDSVGKAIIKVIQGNFINNFAHVSGGAIRNGAEEWVGKPHVGTITGNFIRNRSSADYGGTDGGAISNYGTIDKINGNFIENFSGSSDYPQGYYNHRIEGISKGGAIFNDGTINDINANFIRNQTKNVHADGGAIYNSGLIKNINGIFTENSALSLNYYMLSMLCGGAIYNDGIIENINAIFEGNHYEINVGQANGGAIFNIGEMQKISGIFRNNYSIAWSNSIDVCSGHSVSYMADPQPPVAKGGAIYNASTIDALSGIFENNYTKAYLVGIPEVSNDPNYTPPMTVLEGAAFGGAIYNDGIGTSKEELYQMIADYYDYSDINTMITERGYADTVLSPEEIAQLYSQEQGANYYSSFEDFATNKAGWFGYDSIEEFLADVPATDYWDSTQQQWIENYASSVEEFVQLRGFNSVEDFLQDEGAYMVYCKIFGYKFNSFEDFATNKDGWFGYDTVEEFLANEEAYIYDKESHDWISNGFASSIEEYIQLSGYNSVEEFLADPENIYEGQIDEIAQMSGFDSPEEFVASKLGYSSVDEMMEEYSHVDIGLLVTKMLQEEFGRTLDEQLDYMGANVVVADGKITFVGESTFTNNKANEKLNDIYNSGEITLAPNAVVTSNSGINGNNGKILVKDNAKLNINHYLTDNAVTLDNGSINLGSHEQEDGTTTYGKMDLVGLATTVNGGYLNMINNHVDAQSLGAVNLAGDLNVTADVDLANEQMDTLSATSYTGDGNIVVKGLNVVSDNENDVTIQFTDEVLKDHVVSKVDLAGKDTEFQTTAYSPIFKYNVKYNSKDDGGYFDFTRYVGGGSSSNPSFESFNPAILSSNVASQGAAQVSMVQAIETSFQHADTFMNSPATDRFAKLNNHSYAFSSTEYNQNLNPIDVNESNKAFWVKPYSVFENIGLKNGPKVGAINYGTILGGDSEFKKHKHGWFSVTSPYIGYNGSQLHYSNISSNSNGGLLGVTESFYKGNFWTAISLSAGANVTNTNTMYGQDDTTMLMAGIGSKTGYNFEFKGGKFIIQPRMFVSYNFINTFDYTNAAGVRVDNKPMHTIQLNPSVRLIGNIKDWQPYATVGMVWNLMNETKATANGVKLPEMSIKPYVEYGVGIQKNWSNNYSAYAQATMRNGGRNGIALTLGFRWAIGRDKDKSANSKGLKFSKKLY